MGGTLMTGSLYWMAPEVVTNAGRGYNSKIDLWSLGCVVLEMLSGSRPWQGLEMMPIILKVRRSLSSYDYTPRLTVFWVSAATSSDTANDLPCRPISSSPPLPPTLSTSARSPSIQTRGSLRQKPSDTSSFTSTRLGTGVATLSWRGRSSLLLLVLGEVAGRRKVSIPKVRALILAFYLAFQNAQTDDGLSVQPSSLSVSCSIFTSSSFSSFSLFKTRSLRVALLLFFLAYIFRRLFFFPCTPLSLRRSTSDLCNAPCHAHLNATLPQLVTCRFFFRLAPILSQRSATREQRREEKA